MGGETLQFTARIRLCGAVSDKVAQAQAVAARLGLGQCEGTPLALCSGGEKKRTSIAIEMLKEPSILLLDEPTSGLDSAMAAALAQALRNVARMEDVTVVTSLHQPSSSVFSELDNVMFLCDGHTVYQGPPAAALPYFASLGPSGQSKKAGAGVAPLPRKSLLRRFQRESVRPCIAPSTCRGREF